MSNDCMNCKHFDCEHDYCVLMDELVHPCNTCGLCDCGGKENEN